MITSNLTLEGVCYCLKVQWPLTYNGGSEWNAIALSLGDCERGAENSVPTLPPAGCALVVTAGVTWGKHCLFMTSA